jgi:hypothetical protein
MDSAKESHINKRKHTIIELTSNKETTKPKRDEENSAGLRIHIQRHLS